MAEIAAAQVKALRDKTGAGMMDCKRVLVEAGGDAAKALELLRERGLARARGKAGRVTSDGLIVASVSDDRRQAVVIEVNCETDFVARTDKFQALCEELATLARENGVSDVDGLLGLSLEEGTVNDRVVEAIAKLGENIQVRRVSRLEAPESGVIESYVHAGGKIGSLVHVDAGDPSAPEVKTMTRNLCMHVTAASPLSISREDIPAQEVDRERAVLTKQAESEGKPANILEKMVEGRLKKFYKEVVLLEQPLVMDPDRSVGAAVEEVGARVIAMERFQLGEEIEE
jgi:elongation factor Ts